MGDYYLRQRFYDMSSGRFGRMNTYEGIKNKPMTLNKYIYTHSISHTDPSGLFSIRERIATLSVLAILLSLGGSDIVHNECNDKPTEPDGGDNASSNLGKVWVLVS